MNREQIKALLKMDTSKEGIDARRSRVRVWVTHSASLFVFAGGFAIIAWMLWNSKYDEAKEIFALILPIGTGVITYWFSQRGTANAEPPQSRS